MQRLHRIGARRVLAITGTVLGAACISVASSALSPATEAGATATQSQPSAPVIAPNLELATNVPAFRRARTVADELPASLASRLSNLLPTPQIEGANVNLSRTVKLSIAGGSAYLIPTNEGLCFINDDLSQHFCASTADVLAGTDVASDECSPFLPTDSIEIAGVLPDASGATVTLSSGSTVALPLTEGVYEERFPRTGALPVTISWDAASQPHSTSAQVPSETASEDCVTPAQVKEKIDEGNISVKPSGQISMPVGGTTEYNK